MDKPVSGKLMLLGEYAILRGGQGISVPYRAVSGQLMLDAQGDPAMHSHEAVKRFGHFLHDRFYDYFDQERLSRDLSNGLYFRSNIPQGYGLGSSAALLAALFRSYGRHLPQGLGERKNLFAHIESYFHGHSSGLDVLVCYEDTGILVKPSGIEPLDLPPGDPTEGFSLVDTGSSRSTAALVEEFERQDEGFFALFAQEYVEQGNAAIGHYLSGDTESLFQCIKSLSKFTLVHMPWTIPQSFIDTWARSIDSGNTAMKLCGAGGGGYVLSFSLPG
ncbi:MAG: hypothetical protein HYZ16_06305 [Bacteroidetes bacterium]|jgi:mevalonate kinase|nr:hypothetical protein [Bacteroidota bacterium]